MINFKEVEETVKTLKTQVEAGNLDQTTFEAKMLEMVDVSVDGYYWMFGHKSEQWYRHTGREWVLDDPAKLQFEMPHAFVSPATPSSPPARDSVDLGWFSVGLVVLVVVFGVVYSSAL